MHIKFPYVKKHKYPHLKPYDVAIWDRFLKAYPEAYDHVYYDFEIGDGPQFSTIVNPETGGDDRALYKWKIDVVGVKDKRTDLIEIKPRAGVSAIGQAACYKMLWRRDIDPQGNDRAVIITDEIRPDILYLCHQFKVKIFVV